MKLFESTRTNGVSASAPEAVIMGIAPDGGLFTPRGLDYAKADLNSLIDLSAVELSAEIIHRLLPDFTKEEISALTKAGYEGKFDTNELTPITPLGDAFVLELFRGPTCAFKDVALSILPRLLSLSREKLGISEDIMVLTATSGDTGKAALEGFRDVPGIKIVVFYPENGVSDIQRDQMIKQPGGNVSVCAVRGNFDDAQTGVKAIFTSDQAKSVRLSSANSINIGRLAPQVAYYFKAYFDLINRGVIKMGESVNFIVPTGNFGDILAGEFARRMGLPVNKLVCASNANNVLTDFINTGVYDRRREFIKTASPSMDILVSSNLERYLYLLSGCDTQLISRLMRELSESGEYSLPEALTRKMQETFWAGCADDNAAFAAIREAYDNYGYVLDPHTAVGYAVMREFMRSEVSPVPCVLLATASPFKFAGDVLKALGQADEVDGYDAMRRLSALTGVPAPEKLTRLEHMPVKHDDSVDVSDMLDFVMREVQA